LKSIWEHRDRGLWKIATGIFVVGLACVIVNALVFSNIGFYYLALFLFFVGVVVWFARCDVICACRGRSEEYAESFARRPVRDISHVD